MTIQDLLDREAIRLLMATYTVNGDRARIDALAGVFASTGILEFPGVRAEGLAQIVSALSSPSRERNPQHTFTRHNLTSSLIELDGASATGRTYFQVVTDIGLDHQGHYADRFVREQEGWRISHRQVRIDWQSPQSVYPPFPTR